MVAIPSYPLESSSLIGTNLSIDEVGVRANVKHQRVRATAPKET
jgi:hypothetical protein